VSKYHGVRRWQWGQQWWCGITSDMQDRTATPTQQCRYLSIFPFLLPIACFVHCRWYSSYQLLALCIVGGTMCVWISDRTKTVAEPEARIHSSTNGLTSASLLMQNSMNSFNQ
jgi:hypothetical protein